MMLQEWFSDVFKLLFPRVCFLCKTDLVSEEEHLCAGCILELPETNFSKFEENPLDQKLKGRFDFKKINALYYFNADSKVQDILHEVKYNSNYHLAYYLGKIMAQKLGAHLKNADVLIPVPLHKRRVAERGYNQSEVIAEGIGNFIDLKVETNLVERIRYTETQTSKTRADRIENMKDAFEWKQDIRNKKILLLDDVITTGSTIESLVLAMPKDWNNTIHVASFAVAVNS